MAEPHAFGIAGLLGWPVAHSRSPVIHNYWLAHYGIPGRYMLFPVPPEKLADALRGLAALRPARLQRHDAAQAGGHAAARRRRSDSRSRIGAVNTIVVEKDGSLRGFNNDGNGFVQSIRDAEPDWRPDARADHGARRRRRGARGRREPRRARRARNTRREPHATNARRSSPALFGPPVIAVRWEQRADALDGVALLANATNQGMAGKPPLDIPLDRLPPQRDRRRPDLHAARNAAARRRARARQPAPSTGSGCC